MMNLNIRIYLFIFNLNIFFLIRGTWDVMKKIWKYEGIQGFFKGKKRLINIFKNGRTLQSTTPKCTQYCILIYVSTTISQFYSILHSICSKNNMESGCKKDEINRFIL